MSSQPEDVEFDITMKKKRRRGCRGTRGRKKEYSKPEATEFVDANDVANEDQVVTTTDEMVVTSNDRPSSVEKQADEKVIPKLVAYSDTEDGSSLDSSGTGDLDVTMESSSKKDVELFASTPAVPMVSMSEKYALTEYMPLKTGLGTRSGIKTVYLAVKPSKTHLLDGKVSFRTGYIGSQIVLRISTSNEFGEPYDGVQKKIKKPDGGIVGGNDTVFLTSFEFMMLRERFKRIAFYKGKFPYNYPLISLDLVDKDFDERV
jgi:hypothetical protein